MNGLRRFLVGFANFMLAFIVGVGTIGGFIAGGSSMGYSFHLGTAIVGAIVGFVISAVSASLLAILLDIHAMLERIEKAKSAGL